MRADLPDHAGARNLHQRRIGPDLEASIGIGAPEVADRTIIGDIGTAVGTTPRLADPT
jgi:hypothetical protein